MQFQWLVAVAEQALQFQHGFAWQDDLLLGHFDVELGAGKGQPVAVCCHQAERFAFGYKQDAVEIVANVVNRHGERYLRQEAFERFLRHTEGGAEIGRFLHQREIFGGQRLKRELAFSALENYLALRGFEGDGLIGRHAAQDVDHLARTNAGLECGAFAAEHFGRANLDFQVTGDEFQRFALLAQ